MARAGATSGAMIKIKATSGAPSRLVQEPEVIPASFRNGRYSIAAEHKIAELWTICRLMRKLIDLTNC